MNYIINSNRTNLVDKNTNNFSNIIVKDRIIKNKFYKTIMFNNLDITDILKKQILFFFNKFKIKKESHILVVGLGNDSHTADSVGPKSLKYINVNSFFETFNIKTNNTIISALEPGVLGETGIPSIKIINSVRKEINPDLVIIIDAIVSDNINDLNKTILITDSGINPGFGLFGFNEPINEQTLKIPVITIGVTTAIEVFFEKEKATYFLSSKNIDDYVLKISKIIGNAINLAIDDLN